MGWLSTPVEKAYAKSSWHAYVVKVENRDAFMTYLRERGISTGMHYIPNHLYKMYKPYATCLPVTERIWTQLVTLPLFPDLTDKEVNYIMDSVCQYKPKA